MNNILQDIQDNVNETRDSEMRSKMLLELSERKYNVQKKLRDDLKKLPEREISLAEIRKEVNELDLIFITLEKQEKMAREIVEDLAKQVVKQEQAAEKAQAMYWKKINDFVSKSVRHLKKHPPAAKKEPNNDGDIVAKNRQEKLRQCALQGRLEAMTAFGKYQKRKIEELELIQKMLRN